MSIHPSLAMSAQDKKQRSVLKRTERIRIMQEKNQWKEGDRVYGLPKIKTLRIRIKKEKAEKVAETTVTVEAPAITAPAGKEATPKQAGKPQEKK